jgi:hypothetical protein
MGTTRRNAATDRSNACSSSHGASERRVDRRADRLSQASGRMCSRPLLPLAPSDPLCLVWVGPPSCGWLWMKRPRVGAYCAWVGGCVCLQSSHPLLLSVSCFLSQSLCLSVRPSPINHTTPHVRSTAHQPIPLVLHDSRFSSSSSTSHALSSIRAPSHSFNTSHLRPARARLSRVLTTDGFGFLFASVFSRAIHRLASIVDLTRRIFVTPYWRSGPATGL